MLDTALAVALIALALGIGLAAGWLLRGLGVAALRAERDERLLQFRDALKDIDIEKRRAERIPELERALNEAMREREEARSDAAALRAARDEREQAYQEQLAQLKEQGEALKAEFSQIAGRALEAAQKNFLERADQRFAQAGEKNEAQLKALLQPVETTLKRYEEGVSKVEQERREAYGNLTGLIDAMRIGQEGVRSEAAKLVNALRSAPKARGRWGEQQLRNVLETCGLSEHTDFETEVSVDSEEGRLRPDAIIRVPGGRSLVIDAKVSLNAYQDAYAAVDEGERAAFLSAHCTAMKAHVNTLGSKSYWNEFADAPDYVIMFVPGEHFLSAALEHDPALWDFAFQKRVLLATPTNLIAIARTVAAVWRQEKLASEAKAIGKLGKDIYESLAKASSDLRKMGSSLKTAVDNYNSFVGSFDGRVLTRARRFRDLNVDTGTKEIEEPGPVEALTRLPANHADLLPADDVGLAEGREIAE